jgi:hypothetical protein
MECAHNAVQRECVDNKACRRMSAVRSFVVQARWCAAARLLAKGRSGQTAVLLGAASGARLRHRAAAARAPAAASLRSKAGAVVGRKGTGGGGGWWKRQSPNLLPGWLWLLAVFQVGLVCWPWPLTQQREGGCWVAGAVCVGWVFNWRVTAVPLALQRYRPCCWHQCRLEGATFMRWPAKGPNSTCSTAQHSPA